MNIRNNKIVIGIPVLFSLVTVIGVPLFLTAYPLNLNTRIISIEAEQQAHPFDVEKEVQHEVDFELMRMAISRLEEKVKALEVPPPSGGRLLPEVERLDIRPIRLPHANIFKPTITNAPPTQQQALDAMSDPGYYGELRNNMIQTKLGHPSNK